MENGRIDFSLRGIGTELKERRLAVPIFQRSYAWKAEEAAEFFSDIETAIANDSQEYFLGTLVLTTAAADHFTVIDGQQRLATTAILLAAVRDEYAGRGDAERAGIVQSEFLSTSDLESAQKVSRLQLNSEDSTFFEARIIQGKPSPLPTKSSHHRIIEAHEHFRRQVKRIADDAGPNWEKRLSTWVAFLRSNVKAMVLAVPSDADAFLIFETLNDRGADLTIADLLKNYLFGHAGTKIDPVRDGWMQILGALEISAENAVFTTFLRHFWSSQYGGVRERELYGSIKERVTTQAQVIDFVAELQKAAVVYSALLSSGHEYWESLGGTVRSNVASLIRLELEQNRPLLLAALQHFSTKEKKKLLKALIAWSVRGLVVGGIGGGTAEKAYCRAAVKIRKGEILTSADVLKEIQVIVPTDDEFIAAFEQARFPKASFARYVLIALERGKRGEDEPEFVPNSNEEEVNLEHVLPKRATQADWGAAFGSDERRDYVHRLGNIALLQKGPNGRIGNKPFAGKRAILKKSRFELTKMVASQADWTKEAINKRQKKLAALAVGVWPR